MKEQLQKSYLEWVNHYLTLEVFAADYGITKDQARMLIELGRSIHEAAIEHNKSLR